MHTRAANEVCDQSNKPEVYDQASYVLTDEYGCIPEQQTKFVTRGQFKHKDTNLREKALDKLDRKAIGKE